MSEKRTELEELISKLKQERDEVNLQIHLASMEARDEYDRLSGKVDDLAKEYEPVQNAVEETADNVFSALGLVADELRTGFQRVRKSITDDK